jgi:hypothetical protein
VKGNFFVFWRFGSAVNFILYAEDYELQPWLWMALLFTRMA